LNFVKKHSIFHFSSVILKEKNFQAQIKKILNSKKDKIINFDVNIRYSLWKNHNELKKIVIEYIKLSDIIKFSEKELEFITGSNHSDIKKTLEKTLFLKNKLIIVTLGERGCCAFYNGQFISCNPKFKSKIIDTTGAGDAFVSAFLFQLLKNNIVETKKLQELFSNNIIEKILLFSNAAGTLSATKRGATTGLATEKKIINFMKKL
jgi:fructokinase